MRKKIEILSNGLNNLKITMTSIRRKNPFLKSQVDEKECLELYKYLKKNIQWETGIITRNKKTTRKAKSLQYGSNSRVDEMIERALLSLTTINNNGLSNASFVMGEIYLNYYKDGTMWTPNHSHKNTYQLVISLGTTRTFSLGRKNFPVENGDVLLFGSQIHGIPKEPEITRGRISIAVFLMREN